MYVCARVCVPLSELVFLGSSSTLCSSLPLYHLSHYSGTISLFCPPHRNEYLKAGTFCCSLYTVGTHEFCYMNIDEFTTLYSLYKGYSGLLQINVNSFYDQLILFFWSYIFLKAINSKTKLCSAWLWGSWLLGLHGFIALLVTACSNCRQRVSRVGLSK